MTSDAPNVSSLSERVLRPPIFKVYFHRRPNQRRLQSEEPNVYGISDTGVYGPGDTNTGLEVRNTPVIRIP